MTTIITNSFPNKALECSICNKKGTSQDNLFLCAKCHFATYCSTECQKKDWPKHKKVCSINALLETYKKTIRPETVRINIQYWEDFAKKNSRCDESISDLYRELVDIKIDFFKASRKLESFALNIGCGFDGATFELLENGWGVTCVDFSKNVVDSLKEKALIENKSSSLKNTPWKMDKLSILNQDISEFDFSSKKYQLIIAQKVLNYIHPFKYATLWNNIFESLEPDGFFIGDLSVYSNFDEKIARCFDAQDFWFLKDFKTAEDLLKLKYKIIKFEKPKENSDNGVNHIDFIVQKIKK